MGVRTDEASILTEIKKMIGFEQDYTVFDTDLIIQINSCFSTLRSLGVGPDEGFIITGTSETWSSYTIDQAHLANVKNFVFMKTKMVFDRPETSYAISAMERNIKEIEWRLFMESENKADE